MHPATTTLPPEMWRDIFLVYRGDLNSIITFSLVCKTFLNVVRNDIKALKPKGTGLLPYNVVKRVIDLTHHDEGTLRVLRLVDRNWSKTADFHLHDLFSYECAATDIGEMSIRAKAAIRSSLVAAYRSNRAHDILIDHDARYHRWLNVGWLPDFPEDNVLLATIKAAGDLARAREDLEHTVAQTIANLMAVREWTHRKYVRGWLDGEIHNSGCGCYIADHNREIGQSMSRLEYVLRLCINPPSEDVEYFSTMEETFKRAHNYIVTGVW